MDADEIRIGKVRHFNLWRSFMNLLGLKKYRLSKNEERKQKLEPKYWQEVKEFLDKVTEVIQTHTIEDNNIVIINQRIIDYIAEQINIKGSIENIEERYLALDTLADRILVNNLSKIVGLKKAEGTTADFSDAVARFKKDLQKRHHEELLRLRLNQ